VPIALQIRNDISGAGLDMWVVFVWVESTETDGLENWPDGQRWCTRPSLFIATVSSQCAPLGLHLERGVYFFGTKSAMSLVMQVSINPLLFQYIAHTRINNSRHRHCIGSCMGSRSERNEYLGMKAEGPS
jgi:hypothetical protein